MSDARLTRRAALFQSGLLAFALLPAGWLWSRSRGVLLAAPSRQGAWRGRLLALLGGLGGVRQIGQVVLWRQRAVPNATELVDRIVARGDQPRLAVAPDWQLRREIAARMGADYAALRIVNVGGWLISETEGRLCALSVVKDESGT